MKIKPFIKWVGGKTQLLDDIINNLPDDISSVTTYIEPFIGGGSVLFNISYMFPNLKRIIINDLNTKLINVYKTIKEHPNELINELNTLQTIYYASDIDKKEQLYYDIRNDFNNYRITEEYDHVKYAAQFIFLNKTCFNGLYRENSAGKFNVPWNKSEKPCICDEENINTVHQFLKSKNVIILNSSYTHVFNYINTNDKVFMYLDPPYRPLNVSSSFTAYTKSGFNDDDQSKLKEYCDLLDRQKNYFLLSNSDPKNSDINDNFFDDLYRDYNIKRVNAKRNINSKGTGRGSITEILVKNY